MAKIAFIGLGVMGFPMAGHLQAKGHDVTVYNRTKAKAEAWATRHGGKMALTPQSAAANADYVMTCVGNDNDLRQVVLGSDGIFAGMRHGAVTIDHTTASATIARDLDKEAQKRGFSFIDAPVSGGQAGAENGQLGIMCGGDAGVFAQAKPVLDSYAKACVLIGPVGSGQLTKMVNQICIAGLVQGLAEAMNFGQKAGLDMEKVLAVISKGAAQSWQMENRGKTMCEGKFDFGFAVDWMRKDLGICLDESRHNGARLPVAGLVDQFYAQLQERGHGRWDTSSLMNILDEP